MYSNKNCFGNNGMKLNEKIFLRDALAKFDLHFTIQERKKQGGLKILNTRGRVKGLEIDY